MGVWSFLWEVGVSHEYSAKNSRYVHIMLNYYISAPVSGFTARHETHRFALLCRQEVFESAKPAGAGLPWDPHQCHCFPGPAEDGCGDPWGHGTLYNIHVGSKTGDQPEKR